MADAGVLTMSMTGCTGACIPADLYVNRYDLRGPLHVVGGH